LRQGSYRAAESAWGRRAALAAPRHSLRLSWPGTHYSRRARHTLRPAPSALDTLAALGTGYGRRPRGVGSVPHSLATPAAPGTLHAHHARHSPGSARPALATPAPPHSLRSAPAGT